MARTASASRTWIGPLGALAALAVLLATAWDVSWHQTIGRDNVLMPPHLMLYAGIALSAGLAGWMILDASRRTSDDGAISIGPLRGPTGAWVMAWGIAVNGLAILIDLWWHQAYGLDVAIASVPHTTISIGFLALVGGMLLVVLARLNREPDHRAIARLPLLLLGGCLVLTVAFATSLYAARPNDMHSSLFHLFAALTYPALLASLARSLPGRWPATTAVAIYTALVVGLILVLENTQGTPVVGPVLNEITRFVPPPPPLLLLLPALLFDLAIRRPAGGLRPDPGLLPGEGGLSLGLGIGFVIVFGATQWVFGELLLGPAREWSADPGRWPYYVSLGDWRYEWWGRPLDATARTTPPLFGLEMAVIAVAGIASCRLGLMLGGWAAGLRR